MDLFFIMLVVVIVCGFIYMKLLRNKPIEISSPSIGFLNLMGESAQAWVSADAEALRPMFSSISESVTLETSLDVLLIYGEIAIDGDIKNCKKSLRELIRDSGSKIVVFANDNPAENYIAATKPDDGYGQANLVMTLSRNGESFTDFFEQLFGMMFGGVTMPVAWCELCPQIPGQHPEGLPDTIFSCELGQLKFSAE